MIRNIFLDAGGVILDETEFDEKSSVIITGILNNYIGKYTIENYWKDVDEAVYRYVPKVYDYILYKNIKNINDFKESKEQYKNDLRNIKTKFELMDGLRTFLEIFSKQYKIGILGQYEKDFKEYLKDTNILQYFTFTEIQDDYKITKPDPRYFEAILEKCKCKPEESIMVGDRIDKDIIPAKTIGMKTIRIKTGIHKNQEPRIPEETPDLEVERYRKNKTGNNKRD
jgi:HAD superfamily hydrolase (TIGR01549 family)